MFKKMLSKSFEKDVHIIAKGEVKKGEKKGEFTLTVNGKSITFTANAVPAVGDAVIKQSEKDLYHCPADVLAEKYYINDEDVPSVDSTPLVEELTARVQELEKELEDQPEGILTAEEAKEKDVMIEKLEAQIADQKEEIETLEAANENLDNKIEKLVTPPEDLPPVDYNPDKVDGMDIREAQAAAREGLAFTCKPWCKKMDRYVTYDPKTESYIWNRPDAKPGVITLGPDDYAREDYYIFEVK